MKKIYNFLGLYVLPVIISFYLKTVRIKITNAPDYNYNYVFIFWHSKMIIGWWLFRNKNFLSLVSQSKDGDILNNVLRNWKYKVIRGSSSRSGKESLNEIISQAGENISVVITPDGPRGPAGVIKNGDLIVSNKLDIPVIPVKIIYNRKIVLERSWDKFEVPLPFSKCEVNFGKKFPYKEYLNEVELEAFKKEISEEM